MRLLKNKAPSSSQIPVEQIIAESKSKKNDVLRNVSKSLKTSKLPSKSINKTINKHNKTNENPLKPSNTLLDKNTGNELGYKDNLDDIVKDLTSTIDDIVCESNDRTSKCIEDVPMVSKICHKMKREDNCIDMIDLNELSNEITENNPVPSTVKQKSKNQKLPDDNLDISSKSKKSETPNKSKSPNSKSKDFNKKKSPDSKSEDPNKSKSPNSKSKDFNKKKSPDSKSKDFNKKKSPDSKSKNPIKSKSHKSKSEDVNKSKSHNSKSETPNKIKPDKIKSKSNNLKLRLLSSPKNDKINKNENIPVNSQSILNDSTENKHNKSVKRGIRKVGEKIELPDYVADGVFVSCDLCHKFRQLKYIYYPTDVPSYWICTMHKDSNINCDTPPQDYSHWFDVFVCNKFTLGSIVWARMNGYCWWPAMVDEDPDIELFFWCYENQEGIPSDKVSHYHVTFLDNDVSRAWVLSRDVMTFHESDTAQINFIVQSKGGSRRIHDYKHEVVPAIDNARTALSMSLKDRLLKFSFLARYQGTSNKWTRLPRANQVSASFSEHNRRNMERLMLEHAIRESKKTALLESANNIARDLQLDNHLDDVLSIHDDNINDNLTLEKFTNSVSNIIENIDNEVEE